MINDSSTSNYYEIAEFDKQVFFCLWTKNLHMLLIM